MMKVLLVVHLLKTNVLASLLSKLKDFQVENDINDWC